MSNQRRLKKHVRKLIRGSSTSKFCVRLFRALTEGNYIQLIFNKGNNLFTYRPTRNTNVLIKIFSFSEPPTKTATQGAWVSTFIILNPIFQTVSYD